MTPEKWATIEDIFHRALDCSEQQRAAFLDRECRGDSDLRREVEVLLRHSQKTEESFRQAFLDGAHNALAGKDNPAFPQTPVSSAAQTTRPVWWMLGLVGSFLVTFVFIS